MIESLNDLYNIKQNVLLSDYTTWKIGGPAQYFWEPNLDQLSDALEYTSKNNIPVWYIGRGSNLLIDSKGLEGLVICTKKAFQEIQIVNNVIVAECGVPIPKLSKFAANLGWGGYEHFIGIPGTVGAGIAINAGLTAGGRKEIGDVLLDVEVVNNEGKIWWESKNALDLGYRFSNISRRNLFILKARFNNTFKSSKEDVKRKTAMHLSERKRKQPLSKATAGSTFKQPIDGKPAGWYIEQAGLKGYSIGGAKISEKHANWIENIDNATSTDVLSLISYIKKRIYDVFSVELLEEVKYFGSK